MENRVVVTWTDGDGQPGGIITGKVHRDFYGFEVDHIVRYPGTPSGFGAKMCWELIPELKEAYNLKWILVKIHDNYKPESLRDMAQQFGFVLQARHGKIEYWRKDLV